MLKLPQPFRKQGQQLCNDGNTTLFFDAYNVDQMLEAYRQGLAAQQAQQAQPGPVNAMLVEALQAAEKLEHEALVALSEATYELKVGNTYTTATDTYKANNDLIHRLDKMLNSQYRDRKRAALTAAQQAQLDPFTPDWSQDSAAAESIREHQAICNLLLKEMRHIAGISTGQVKRVAEQALEAVKQAQPERAPSTKGSDQVWFAQSYGIKQGGQ